MKYSKKQLIKAWKDWTIEQRLNPSNFMTEDECINTDVDKYSKMCVNQLIKRIK
jgi:hypothetical protein